MLNLSVDGNPNFKHEQTLIIFLVDSSLQRQTPTSYEILKRELQFVNLLFLNVNKSHVFVFSEESYLYHITD